MLRCPLCLQSLPDGSHMIRYCRRHPTARTEFVISNNDFEGIFCHEPDRLESCSPASDIENGVFLFHVGCQCTSPFLIPGSDVVDVAARSRMSNGKTVNHWEIAVADEIAKVYNRSEMWFPQALFRAANEPLGCLVMLAGASSVGKTVLSLVAMNGMTYRSGRRVQHFAHITDSGASNEDLLLILDVLNQFRAGKMTQSMMPTTAAHIANVKSVFLARDPNPVPSRRNDTEVIGPTDVIWNLVGRLIKPGSQKMPEAPPSHTVVAFYDTSGELWQQSSGVSMLNIRSNVDVQAVLIDMTAFKYFDPSSTSNSSWVALDQLEKARANPGARSLVVTKFDAVPRDKLETIVNVDAFTNALQKMERPNSTYREILSKCLANSSDDIERRLWSVVESDTHLEIFFVWTEGLEKPGKTVRSYGLEPFVDWCLGLLAAP